MDTGKTFRLIQKLGKFLNQFIEYTQLAFAPQMKRKHHSLMGGGKVGSRSSCSSLFLCCLCPDASKCWEGLMKSVGPLLPGEVSP